MLVLNESGGAGFYFQTLWSLPVLRVHVHTHKCGRSVGEHKWKESTFIAADMEQLDLCVAISAVGVTV